MISFSPEQPKPILQSCGKKANPGMHCLSKVTISLVDCQPILKTSIGPQAWNPYLRKDIECLETIQHRATKLVPELRNLEYSESLTTLEEHRERDDLIETYKIVTGKEKKDKEKFFKLRDNTNTRENSMKIYKPRLRKNIQQRVNFFSVRGQCLE